MDILEIRSAAQKDQIFFTEHAVRQMAKRNIIDEDVFEIISSGKIIEEYPADKYGPSCLIYGQTVNDRQLHIVCSLPPRVRIITVYQPDPAEWIEYQRRKG